MMKNLPNILTISRIALIPVIIGSFYIDTAIANWVAATLFLFASITDYFDGMLARALSAQSLIGRFLDPIADKLLVSACIVMLVHFNRADVIPALLIICREILVSGLREFLAGINVSVPVSKLSKIKTGVQMGAIFLLLLGNNGEVFERINHLGNIALWLAALLTILTGYAYLQSGLKHMANHE
ncbi:MAG: CDP-diacylglycerol--glycerol-3-phosphate 3-phosphatidyltransferase [Alphaproteobacteria bacterium]|nr:CDP-diacylglycerol--glycerol-3-phosphate 3-phosphatidyltransferase [Alphaproteobacteria bacterium]